MKRPSLTILLLFLLLYNGIAQVSFQESSQEVGLVFDYKESLKMGGGAVSFDYDNDGDEDIFVVGGQNSDGLFENDGTGQFTDVSMVTGISELTASVMSTAAVTGDIDNDGYREIFIATIGESTAGFGSILANFLLKYNPITSKYENIIESVLIDDVSFCMGGHFFDSNQDGLLDLYLINYVEEPRLLVDGNSVIGFDHDCYDNKLYVNMGGFFIDQTLELGLDSEACSLAATSSDLDVDGFPDLIVANDFGKWLQPNQLFKNNGYSLPYDDISAPSNTNAQMYGMGIGVGDYDEDLDLDFYVTNIGPNFFFRNEGDMVFTSMAEELDIQNTFTENNLLTTGWGAILEDFNNDSYLDLFVSNGYVYSAVDVDDTDQSDELYLGSSNKDFTNVTAESGINFLGPSRGALCGDWNSDGFLDLITITNENLTSNPQNSVNYYKNNSAAGNWIGFDLKGTQSNADAYGTRLIAYSGERKLLREIRGGDSHASQNSSRIHIGLGEIEALDSIVIHWISGKVEVYNDLTINQYHQLTEGTVSSADELHFSVQIRAFPNPATDILNIDIPVGGNSNMEIAIYDNLGQIVIRKNLVNSSNKIDISGLPSGVYTVKCTSNSLANAQTVVIL